ncbi:hypothetical protein [Anaerotignum sp.]|uniref:hypothetical protein n=1 Tax=Anaerotignum sp. TaxID=2039241 RepID=UPI0028A0E8A5|nr:hypothetical protein [Anaerotignum sp.]
MPTTTTYALEEKNNLVLEDGAKQSDIIITPQSVNVDTKYGVKRYLSSYTENVGKKTEFYNGSNFPNKEKGETVTPSTTVNTTHALSGSLSYQVKKTVQATLGYTFSDSVSFGIAKQSRPLAVGEYVIAYYQKMYSVTPVEQERTVRTYGYETVNGVTRPVDYTKKTVNTAYAKKAMVPDIELVYKKAAVKGMRSANAKSDITIAIETYSYINGVYVLTSTNKLDD